MVESEKKYNFLLINKAFSKASILHENQCRKGTTLPYIIHPMEVAKLLFQMHATTEQICAGFLHDTIEDTPYTLEEVEKDFNKEVCSLVNFCSEEVLEKQAEHSKETWQKRKEEVVEKIKTASDAELLVLFADKLSNLKSFVDEFKEEGEDFWGHFHGDKQQQLWFYTNLWGKFKEEYTSDKNCKTFLDEFKEYLKTLWPEEQF